MVPMSEFAIQLVGLHHFHQWMAGARLTPLEREQRDRFAESIAENANEFRPNIVADTRADRSDICARIPTIGRSRVALRKTPLRLSI
jgi:hypothetical protein